MKQLRIEHLNMRVNGLSAREAQAWAQELGQALLRRLAGREDLIHHSSTIENLGPVHLTLSPGASPGTAQSQGAVRIEQALDRARQDQAGIKARSHGTPVKNGELKI